MDARTIQSELKTLADKKNAEVAQRFFKTGPGEYGEGDIFIGIRVPVLRRLARKYQTIPIKEAEQILKSPIHEERLLALFILWVVRKPQEGPEETTRQKVILTQDDIEQTDEELTKILERMNPDDLGNA